MTRTHPLGAPNMEVFHANKMAHFTCYFEPIFQEPEHMHVDHFKYVKLCVYMFGRRMQSFETRFQHQVGHQGYYRGGGHR